MYHSKDKQKAELAKEKGITLINIPFWWDWRISRYVNNQTLNQTSKKKTKKVEIEGTELYI